MDFKRADPIFTYLYKPEDTKTICNYLANHSPGLFALIENEWKKDNQRIPSIVLFVKRPSNDEAKGQGYTDIAEVHYFYHKERGWITPDSDHLDEDLKANKLVPFTAENLKNLLFVQFSQKNLPFKNLIIPENASYLPQDAFNHTYKQHQQNLMFIKAFDVKIAKYFEKFTKGNEKSIPDKKIIEMVQFMAIIAKEIQNNGHTQTFFSTDAKNTDAIKKIRDALDFLTMADFKAESNEPAHPDRLLQISINEIWGAIKDLPQNNTLGKNIENALQEHYPKQLKTAQDKVMKKAQQSKMQHKK